MMVTATTGLLSSASSIVVMVVAVLGTLGVCGAAVAYFGGGKVKTTLFLLKTENDELRATLGEQRTKNTDQQVTLDRQDATLKEQDRRITELRDMVQGVRAIQDLSEKIDRNHEQVITALSARRTA